MKTLIILLLIIKIFVNPSLHPASNLSSCQCRVSPLQRTASRCSPTFCARVIAHTRPSHPLLLQCSRPTYSSDCLLNYSWERENSLRGSKTAEFVPFWSICAFTSGVWSLPNICMLDSASMRSLGFLSEGKIPVQLSIFANTKYSVSKGLAFEKMGKKSALHDLTVEENPCGHRVRAPKQFTMTKTSAQTAASCITA
jgi:hypothetical protein